MSTKDIMREVGNDAQNHILVEQSSNTWVEITGYAYPYRINEYAVVQRYVPEKGEWRTLKANCSRGRRPSITFIVTPGVRKDVRVVNLMAEAFMGGRKAHPGKVLFHKNGCSTDCSRQNLKWLTLQECGSITGKLQRRAVEKVDKDGNVVEIFRSIQECCEKEFISKSTLWRIIYKRTKKPYGCTGYTYRYESRDK